MPVFFDGLTDAETKKKRGYIMARAVPNTVLAGEGTWKPPGIVKVK